MYFDKKCNIIRGRYWHHQLWVNFYCISHCQLFTFCIWIADNGVSLWASFLFLHLYLPSLQWQNRSQTFSFAMQPSIYPFSLGFQRLVQREAGSYLHILMSELPAAGNTHSALRLTARWKLHTLTGGSYLPWQLSILSSWNTHCNVSTVKFILSSMKSCHLFSFGHMKFSNSVTFLLLASL